MLWFYRDESGSRQGPFYPGQMRQWFQAGYFPKSQLLAPSFRGEVPRTFAPLTELFPADTAAEFAFTAADHVALWPPAVPNRPLPTNDDDDIDGDEDVRQAKRPARPQWLEQSIERQRNGIKRRNLYGPVERENYN